MEMTFREIVKLIHPDLNPDITDASSKMVIVKAQRNNTKALGKYAVLWGVVPKPAPDTTSNIIRTGDIIYVISKGATYTVTKVTNKRYYFTDGIGYKSFCIKKNAVKQGV